MMLSLRLLSAAIGSIVAVTGVPVQAQVVRDIPLNGQTIWEAWTKQYHGAPMPSVLAELDRLWARRDFVTLMSRLRGELRAEKVFLDLNWERARVLEGAGYPMVNSYMQDLFRLGSAVPAKDGEDLKQAAGMMFAYGFNLITLDGLKCADRSAPSHWRDQLMLQNPDITSFIVSSSRAARMYMGTISLAFEAATSSLRTNDEVLCGGGLAEISAALLANGDKPLQPLPLPPGMSGKSYSVPSPPGCKAKFVGEQIWRPKQNEVRVNLAALLTKLLTIPSESQPSGTASPPVKAEQR